MASSRKNSIARLAARATGLGLVLGAGMALAQDGNLQGLRGTGTTIAGNNLTPATGTAVPGGLPLTGANPRPQPPIITSDDPAAPNYSRPRKPADPRLKYAGQRKKALKPLPLLQPYPGPAAARRARADPGRGPIQPEPDTNVAAIPTLTVKARPKIEEAPFAPVGLPIGSLRLVPFVDSSAGWDSNPNRSSGGSKGSASLRGEIGAAWKSDWSAHEFKGDIKGAYTKYFSAPLASRPDGAGKMNLRLDVSRDTALDFELRGSLDTQRPGSANFTPTAVKSRPLVLGAGATAGGTQKFGGLELSLRGAFDRVSYENATLVNGTRLALSGDSYNAFGLRARAGYQITPGITPFLEVGGDTRRRDQAVDTSGFARNSNGGLARAGSTFELTRTLTGEIAAGYAQRVYADSRLPTLAGPTFDASLVWTASPLTTVSLKAATALGETTIANASGAVNRTLTLDVSHAFLRNFTLGAAATVGVNEYRGISLRENTFSGTLKAEYLLNRSVSVRGSFTHERLQSTAPGSDYTANVFLLGLKLQR